MRGGTRIVSSCEGAQGWPVCLMVAVCAMRALARSRRATEVEGEPPDDGSIQPLLSRRRLDSSARSLPKAHVPSKNVARASYSAFVGSVQPPIEHGVPPAALKSGW